MNAYVGSDNVIRLTNARAISLATGLATALTAGAAVTFRVQTEAYVDVPGETWPQTMTYIAGSTGDFLGVLRNEVALAAGATYRLIGTVTGGTDQYGTWDIPLRVLTRF
jgi:hypothetical protein